MISLTSSYQGIVKSTVSGVFEDLLRLQAKLKLSWVCPVSCLSLAETANRAKSGQLDTKLGENP